MEIKKKGINNLSILSIACILVIVIGILSWINVRHFKKTITSNIQQHLLTNAKLQAENIREFFLGHKRCLKMLAENPHIKKAILNNDSSQDIQRKEGYSYEQDLYDNCMKVCIDGLYRLDANGIVQSRIPHAKNSIGSDFSNKFGVKAIIETHKPHVSKAFTVFSGDNCFSVCYPVFEGEEFIGIIRTIVSLDKINRMVGAIELVEKGYAIVLDDNGTILAHPNADFLLRDALTARKEFYPDYDWSVLENIIAKMKKGEEGIDSYYSARWDKEKPILTQKLTAFAPVRLDNELWSIGIIMAYTEIAASIHAYTRNVIFVAGLFMVIVVAGSIWFHKAEREKRIFIAQTAENLEVLNCQLQEEIVGHKKAEQSLRETREYLENLINYANAPIIVWGPDLKISIFNHAFEHLTGLSADEAIGGELDILFPEQSRSQSLLEIKRTLGGVHWQSVEIPILQKNGNIKIALWNSANIYAEDGTTLVATIAQGIDITERKKAEQQRERLMRMLESKNEELQSIVYISSHDLKSPLINIDGFSGIFTKHCDLLNELLKDSSVDENIKRKITPLLEKSIPEDLEFITGGIKKMKMLIDGLLQVSRIGTIAVDSKNLDVNEIVNSVINNLKFKSKEKNVTITTDNLPDCYGNMIQINQVFSNLLDNALNYLDPTRKGIIHVSGKVEDGKSVYCVCDNGIGILPDYQNNVFEIFHRLDPTGSIQGEGLGLTIVKRIIQRHNGDIRLESEPGKGSKFIVSLPKEGE